MPFISVIIPTCNRISALNDCLTRLHSADQCINNADIEIIVTDDSKEKNSFGLIRQNFPRVQWMPGPQKGPAANRNNGAKHAKGEWLIFLDDDCLPDRNLICAYLAAIKNFPGLRVFEGYINADRKQKNFLEESPINTQGGYLWSCNFMIQKKLFNNVLQGFDENYPFASIEDVDLYYRLKKLNEPVKFISNAKVIHPWRLQTRPFVVANQRFSSLIYFLNKFPEERNSYDAKYFLRAFLNYLKEITKNLFDFRFTGLPGRLTTAFLQLYFAWRVTVIFSKQQVY